jgi:cytochrome c
MPYPAPQSLSDDEVYAISAYVLYLNDIVDEDFVATKESFTQVKMPNEPNFYIDNRPDVQNTRCMEDCADPSQFEIVTTINGVTPTGHFKEDSGVATNHYGGEKKKEALVEVAMSEAALSGKPVYDRACQACHNIGVAGAPKIGDAEAWADRIATGMKSLNSNAINGYQGSNGVMPAKGGNMSLSDGEVKNAVAYMVESSR